MLNITENSIADKIEFASFNSYKYAGHAKAREWILKLFLALLIISIVIMFLPWTQNINAKGYVTTRNPESRPQEIQAIIGGRIEEWYVREGDFVSAGDTIAYVTEVKSEYFDPDLVANTESQVRAKQLSVDSYQDKVTALDAQAAAMREGLILKRQQLVNKIEQTRNKIAIDSADLVAQEANLDIAKNQVERIQNLYDKDLKSLSELQEKTLKLQETVAKVTSQRNKLRNQRNELANAILELPVVERNTAEKLAKIRSDQQSAISNRAQSLSDVSKLRSQANGYLTRQQYYYITAPQNGLLTKTVKEGLGEILKEGDNIATIVPETYDLAVELYVEPQDLPLLSIGERAVMRFDGWPVIVISGWPEASTGIFWGEVVAIDRFVSENGKYRILISPDLDDRDWPLELRVGTGAQAFVLLDNVPIWWELWRQLNGFPAEFYSTDDDGKSEKVKRKTPLKTVK